MDISDSEEEKDVTSGPSKMREKKIHKVRYDLLEKSMNHVDQQAVCKLKIPSNVPLRYDSAVGVNPWTALNVKQPAQDTYCVTVMREVLHKNILHAKVVMEKDNHLLVWSDPYSGKLSKCLESKEYYIPNNTRSYARQVIPLPKLQSIVSQILDGMEGLWSYGKYHGNFRLDNTYYYKPRQSDIIVKLANFECNGTTMSVLYQIEDLRAMSVGLDRISEIVDGLIQEGFWFECSQLEDLATKLKEVSPGDFCYAMREIRKRPFFWTRAERKYFFASQVPLALHNPSFRAKIEKQEKLCNLPWGESFNGFLEVMVTYRKEQNMDAYDYNSRVSYVQFISGLYTHEFFVKLQFACVDTTVMKENPGLCVQLYSLLPPPPRYGVN